jgi:hypothetical protein
MTEPGFYNSGLILKNLLQNQFEIRVHLEGGTAVSGTVLGWDADYLMLRQEKKLQMIPMPKVLRLEVDLNEVMSGQRLAGSLAAAALEPVPGPVLQRLSPHPDSALSSPSQPERPARDIRPAPVAPGRLDELVRNW